MKISVIIPTFNQAQALDLVLEAFSDQHTMYEFDIIVVDDGSTENILSIVDKYLSKDIANVKLIRQKNKGRANARNTGIVHSDSEIIIFNDSDRIPSRDFVQQHAEFYLKYGGVTIGTPKEIYVKDWHRNSAVVKDIINVNHKFAKLSPFSKSVLHIYDSSGQTNSQIPWISTFSGNMTIARKYAESIRFDENFIKWGFENIELGYRLALAGVKFHHNACAVNYHLAHARDPDFYEIGIEESSHVLSKKYEDPAILNIDKYILGKITLQDYEMKYGNKDASWLQGIKTPIQSRLIHIQP